MTKHRNPTLIEFGHPHRSLCQPLCQPLCRSLCRPRVQTRFKQGSDKVQTRLLTRFRQGENPSKQGSTRLNKVEFFPVAPKYEGGSQSLLPHSTFPLPAYGCKAIRTLQNPKGIGIIQPMGCQLASYPGTIAVQKSTLEELNQVSICGSSSGQSQGCNEALP